MFIVYGTKRKEFPKGLVADYCPICHDIETMAVVQINMVSHMYFLSVGDGKPAAQQLTCRACGNVRHVHVNAFRTFTKDRNADLEQVIAETNPDIRDELAAHLQANARLRQDPASLSASERQAIIAEALIDVNAKLDSSRDNLSIGGICCFFVAVTSGIATLVQIVRLIDRPPVPPLSAWILAAVCPVICAYSIWLYHVLNRRHNVGRALIWCVESLWQLQPSTSELEEVRQKLVASGYPSLRGISGREIARALNQVSG